MPPNDEKKEDGDAAAAAAAAVPAGTTSSSTSGNGNGNGNGNGRNDNGRNDNGEDEEGVPVTSIQMKLLDLRLKSSTAIIQSVIGEFLSRAAATGVSHTSSKGGGGGASSGEQQICVCKARGVLELYAIVTIKNDKDDDDDDDDDLPPRTVLKLLQRLETHSIVRQITPVRLTGEKRDLLAVASDSGALSLLDFSKPAGPAQYQTVPFGKVACRRSTPGQYVASDPKGRAVMIAAIEKRKLVYVLNHASGATTIASPLEAHRSRSITFAVVGVDNGYDNPLFAALEQQYPDTADDDHEGYDAISSITGDSLLPPKQLAYYELDLGLNHVSRKWAVDVPATANCLAALPGGADGPSGVLVGVEDALWYYHPEACPTGVACVVPRRTFESHPQSRGLLMTHIVVHKQKKGKFFAVAQSELGDVYKIAMDLNVSNSNSNPNPNGDGDGTESGGGAAAAAAAGGLMTVDGLTISVLDTLPVANSLNISKKGLLFCAAEWSDHGLYQFERIDLPQAPTNTSDDLKLLLSSSSSSASLSTKTISTAKAIQIAKTFVPTRLVNLRRLSYLDNPAPTTGLLVGELAGHEVSPQLYTLAGKGPSSTLRILRHGASVTELAVSDLPGVPGGIFTIQDINNTSNNNNNNNKAYSKYIVVSFADATLVLSVGETVEEVGRESGFLTNVPTLATSAFHDGSIVQIHPNGVRHILTKTASQWNCPGLKRIECASANPSQVLIALAGGEIRYFELDALSSKLEEGPNKQVGADVCCVDVGPIPKGKSRSLLAAIGCRDLTVRIVRLEPGVNKLLQPTSSTALKARPHSVKWQYVSEQEDYVLMIGLDDGSSLRATVDPITGAMGTSPTRRFLGARPVTVSRVPLEGDSALLLLSSRPWISRPGSGGNGKHIMAPLSYAPLDYGCAFSSESVPEGVVATAGKTLRIISVDTAGMEGMSGGGGDDEAAFNANRVPLRYTPRQMTLLSTATAAATPAQATTAVTTTTPPTPKRKVVLAVVESDYNDYGQEEKESMGFDPSGDTKKSTETKKDADAMDMDEDSDEEDEVAAAKKKNSDDEEEEEDPEDRAARATPIRGPVPPEQGHWGSCIRLVDPADSCRTLDCVEMTRNEAALCCASVRFHTRGGESLLAVGTVTGMTLQPLQQTASHIVLYRVVNGDRLQLLHRTTVEDGPVLALAHFQGRLLVGIGRTLRLYEMGKRQLLRKCELKGLPTFVKTLQTAGDRAYFGDMMRSLHMIRYEPTANRLVLVANDPSPRPIVCQELLDWNTVAVGDKFGNVCILRLPRGADTGSSIDMTGQRALWDSARADGTAKLEVLCQYYVGEVVTSMTRASLVAGGAESLIYVTVTGRIGALVPFTSRDEVDFYTQLEGYLRTDAPRPTGRDPQAYRSYYAPVMHVVDGDLCDAFTSLGQEEQAKIASQMDRTVGEILKKLEDTRNSLL